MGGLRPPRPTRGRSYHLGGRGVFFLIARVPEILAEAVRFELTDGCPSLVFKTSALNHSATLPHYHCLFDLCL